MSKNQETKMVGGQEEADAITKLLSSATSGVGSKFVGADGVLYEVVEEQVADGSEYKGPLSSTDK